MNQNTTVIKGNEVKRQWILVDVANETLGRACTKIAQLLMGKQNPDFSYHRDDGAYVVVINASEIRVTGKKATEKIYYHHTAFAGHLKELTFNEMMAKDPREVIKHGVFGMLPKNRLRDRRLQRLKVFVGADHKYADKLATK